VKIIEKVEMIEQKKMFLALGKNFRINIIKNGKRKRY
jgi:hypothetical protein